MAQWFLSLFLVSATGFSGRVGVTPNRGFSELLLGPLLAICLSCATPTPFPLENLEEGMTSEIVRENFGEPEAMEADSKNPNKSCWSYAEEQNMVLLDFEEDELVRWSVYEPLVIPGTWTYTYGPTSPYPSSPPSHGYTLKFEGGGVFDFPDPPTCESVREQTGRLAGLKVGDTGYVGPDRASLWSDPTISRARRARLNRGQRLKILDKQLAAPVFTWWCHVEEDYGAEGWILCEFLAASEPP